MIEEKILIADDEELLRNMLKEYLSPAGYVVDEAEDGFEAMMLFKQNKYALVVLDVMMPKMDGWSVCREIRQISNVPVIMLTARGEEYDKLYGFELGVDDYLVKPFSPRELLARIKAIIKRSAGASVSTAPGNKVSFEGLDIDFDAHNVYVDGMVINLTPKEYDLLNFFARHPNRVFSREQLLENVWGYDFTGHDRTVDTHVKMLRDSLGHYRKFIVTVWGTGYKFETGAKK
ncbi:Transcriptional regulatory protein SrrA [Sporotomaculum syntrophicum]|uniref:Stage 0 sporulation protein A homolog n=1 Tax=Sporotomaculum syntrophicum TaxID=182264 RepID=A0A9D2WQK1_9FIRM|nr:response regulator transcription factor [Sporotomaculum syntrophicum]KAF1085295.1 Transcriptional regulatory protein SrrA [Sporotomaculum syntrophicum]